MGLLGRFVPVTRLGAAVWAWRNRDEIADWARTAARATGKAVEAFRSELEREPGKGTGKTGKAAAPR